MNVLEKILDEINVLIEKHKNKAYELTEKEPLTQCYTETDIEQIKVHELVAMKENICSHMNNLQDADAEEKPILCTVGEDGVLTSYDDTYDVIIHCSSKEDQDRTIELIKNFNWIPVSERLPEVPEGTEDDDCPEFNVMIEGAKKATTLKCATDGTWFDDWGEVYKVVAWKSLPEPYRGE